MHAHTRLLEQKQRLSSAQWQVFQSEIARTRKSVWVAYLFWLFLGGLGAHQWYLGDRLKALYFLVPPVLVIVAGMVQTPWLAVLAFVAWGLMGLWDALTMPRQTEWANAWLEAELIATLTGTDAAPAPTDYEARLDALEQDRRWRSRGEKR